MFLVVSPNEESTVLDIQDNQSTFVNLKFTKGTYIYLPSTVQDFQKVN